MGWFILPLPPFSSSLLPLLIVLSLFTPLSSTECSTDECKETSQYLLAMNDSKDACTDTFVHTCTSEKRKKMEIEERQKVDELKKRDRRILVEYLEGRKELNDSISSGIRRLNESCINFNRSLAKSMKNDLEKQFERNMSIEHVTGFASRGRPILFRTKFVQNYRGGPPIFLFRNVDHAMVAIRSFASRQKKEDKETGIPSKSERIDSAYLEINKLTKIPRAHIQKIYDFEVKLFKLKPVERSHNDYRIYKYDEFVKIFSTTHWNMSQFLEGFAPLKSMENITVEDPQGIHYAVKIISDTRKKDENLLKDYVKIGYIQKMPHYHFMKRKAVDFPNPNVTDSTQQEDCLSLIIRFFPFLLSETKKNTTNPEFTDWTKKATHAVKKAFYRQIDDSDWLEPFEKIVMLDIIRKMKVFVYRNKPEDKEEDNIEYKALANAMNSTDLLHNLREMEGSPANSISSIEDSAYTLIHTKEVFLQLHEKKSEVYNTIFQVGVARIINTLGHEIGHHVTDHLNYILSGRGFSDRYLRHLRNTLDCYRRVADEGLEDSSLFRDLSEVNSQRVLREVVSDIMGVQIGPEAYSYLDVELLPGMKTKEEMYYRATTTSEFYCTSRKFEDLLNFFGSTHPVQSQRIEYIRLFDKTPHFGRTFNCTPKKPVCPYVF